MRHAAVDLDAHLGHLTEFQGVVGQRVDRLGDVLAHLVLIDIDGGHDIDVPDMVTAQVDVHQAGDELVFLGVLIIVQALDQR